MRFLQFIGLSLFLLSTTLAVAQTNDITGQILDQKTNQPIPGVSILIQQSNRGVTSDEKGNFTIKQVDFPVQLIFSHIGYEDQQLQLSQAPPAPLSIRLTPGISQLNEVVISAEKIVKPLSEIEKYSVKDFELTANNIMQLEYHGTFKKLRLSLLNLNGDVIDAMILKKIKQVEALHRSCTNTIYLLTQLQAYRIDLHNNEIKLGNPIDIRTFDEFIKPCQFVQEQNQFFLLKELNDLVVRIKKFNPQSATATTIRVIADEQQVNNYLNDYSYIQAGSAISNILVNTWQENQKVRRFQAKADFRSKVFYKPEFPVHIYPNDQQLVLLNHPHQQIEIYKADQLVKEVDIEYPSNKKWLKKSIYDPVTQNIYCLFKNNKGIIIQQLELETGSLSYRDIIDAKPFQLKKIYILNNRLFYLKEDPLNSNKNELLMQRI